MSSTATPTPRTRRSRPRVAPRRRTSDEIQRLVMTGLVQCADSDTLIVANTTMTTLEMYCNVDRTYLPKVLRALADKHFIHIEGSWRGNSRGVIRINRAAAEQLIGDLSRYIALAAEINTCAICALSMFDDAAHAAAHGCNTERTYSALINRRVGRICAACLADGRTEADIE